MKHFAIHKLSKTQPSLLSKVSDRLCCGDGDSIVLHSYYVYDHAGERTLKLTGDNDVMDVNADEFISVATLNNLTMYPSPYLVLTDRGYTKHYYTGSERLCARIGGGNLQRTDQVILQNNNLSQKANDLFKNCLNMNRERELSHDYNVECITGINEDNEELRHWIDGIPIRLNSETQIDLQTFKDMMNHYTSVEESEDEVFFYHSDHLGSASWITNGSGNPVQHLQYMPYGEPFVNERTSAYEERFTFTGKERDSETGFSYFGARYYDSDLMTGWLSVDPMADKYPSLSPYAYCAWNPVKLVDPDGRTIWIEDGSGTKIEYKVNMKPVGNKDASKQIGLLNEMYSTDLGMELLDVLIESNNDYYITNESSSVTGTCNTTKYGNGAKLKMGGNNDLLNISHELFHAYQYECGFGGATYKNEVEAYLFSNLLTLTVEPFSYSSSLCSRNSNTADGKKFANAIFNLISSSTFSDADFRTAVDLFQAESEANSLGVYNASHYTKGDATYSLLSNFYPLIR